MKKIAVLGTGCKKCVTTEERVRKVVQELGMEAVIEKVTDIKKIMEYEVFLTPAVAVDGEVVLSGKVPTEEQLKSVFSS